MSEALKPIKRGLHVITHPGKYLTHPVKAGKKVLGIGNSGGAVQDQGGPPTIDMAAQNQAAVDRIRMRRGVLSNIYGGASNATPSVGTKSLMGQ